MTLTESKAATRRLHASRSLLKALAVRGVLWSLGYLQTIYWQPAAVRARLAIMSSCTPCGKLRR
jgi:hypothetical protein